jgi:hypothetical protein
MTDNTPYHFLPSDHILDLNGRPLPGYALDAKECMPPPGA